MSGICLILLGILFIMVGKYSRNDGRNNGIKSDDDYIRGYQDALKSINSRHDTGEMDDESID